MTITTKRKSTAPAPAPAKTNVLTVTEEEGKTRERQMAELGLSSTIANAMTSATFAKGAFGVLNLAEAVGVMREKIACVKAGDLSDVEATLTAQAATLDTVFNELARRAALNMGEHLTATETYLRLAFKAQAQCRATLETLAEVKYPKAATFVRQQNVAYQQQVNNGGDNATNTRAPAHGKPSNKSDNELLEAQHGERMDTGATSKAGDADPHLEAMGEVYRA
ncbi:MAG: hypothetical protein V4633_20755 [Pseudomonadota bacterium]